MPVIPPEYGKLLGRQTLGSAAANVPAVTWTENFQWLKIYHYIAGYSASTIAIVRFGNGSSVDTGSNYSSITQHFPTGTTTPGTCTTRTSQGGLQVANDAVNTGRRGVHDVWNPATEPKSMDSRTETFSTTNPTSSTASQASLSLCFGTWWNTTDQIHCADMAAPTGTLNAGSYLEVYGLYARL